MIFHSAEEFFTYTKHNKTDIYLFSKKHTTIKKRKDGRYINTQIIKKRRIPPKKEVYGDILYDCVRNVQTEKG